MSSTIGTQQTRCDITCERCGTVTNSLSAAACLWWPAGCQNEEWRICWDCCTRSEKQEVVATGCIAAYFALTFLGETTGSGADHSDRSRNA